MSKTERKLFWQYLSLMISIMLIVCTVLFCSAAAMLKSYTEKSLENNIDEVIHSFMDAQDDSIISENLLDEFVQFLSDVGRIEIIMFDNYGNIKITTEGYETLISGKTIDESIEKVIAGEKVVVETKSDFFYNNIAIGKPMVYNKYIIGGTLCVISGEFISAVMTRIFDYALIFGMLMLLIFILIARFLAKRQASPVNMLMQAIRVVAAGNFEKYVPLELKGDLEEVSADFNKMALAIQKQEQTGKDFIGNISHEMRTPLTIITGFLQGIVDGTVPEEKKTEYITLVINETKRLTRLVNELLEIARLESASNSLNLQNFDINHLIKQVLIKFENNIENKNLKVKFSWEQSSCMVSADKDKIERVLTNLTDNAVKFAQAGGYISISTAIAGGKVQVRVENSGEGIPQEDIDSIWNRFHKSDKSRSADKLGVGLGLYIVKNIINQHGEYITVESIQGQYTRFMFTLSKERSLKNGNKN